MKFKNKQVNNNFIPMLVYYTNKMVGKVIIDDQCIDSK